MDRALLKAFWGCGDNEIIEFAIMRARLNKMERDAVKLILDECMTQEQSAEYLSLSVRCFQEHWSNACKKLLSIPWVYAYGKQLEEEKRRE